MLVYRVFAFDPKAPAGSSGHPDYLYHPQGSGRCDNPGLYDAWYYATTPEAALAEVFGDLATWSAGMFDTPYLPTGRRALGVYELPDDVALLDLDDAKSLNDRGLRPTQVVFRIRSATQAWSKLIFEEKAASGKRAWQGVRWWSYWKPHWTVFVVWIEPAQPVLHSFVRAEALDLTHAAVESARKSLNRPVR